MSAFVLGTCALLEQNISAKDEELNVTDSRLNKAHVSTNVTIGWPRPNLKPYPESADQYRVYPCLTFNIKELFSKTHKSRALL